MKKTLIALAAVAATSAFAQSTVTITGVVDPSFVSAKTTYGDNGARTVNAVKHSQNGTTAVIFKGTEDLGGGLKANFLWELDFDPTVGGSLSSQPDNKNQFQNGEAFASIQGGFGELKLGVANNPSLGVQAGRTGFGTKVGGGFGGVSGTGRVRDNGSMVYSTPTFSGFTAMVGYTPETSATTLVNSGAAAVAKVTAKTDLALMYANGPIAAAVSSYAQSGVNAQTNAYVSYDLGVAKVTLGMHTENQKVAASAATAPAFTKPTGKSSGTNIAIAAPMGAVTLLANYGTLNDKSASNFDRSITAVGANYALSKRTTAYARLVNETNDNQTGATIAKKVQTTMVGLRHNF
jgi:predicted porin